MIRSTFLIVICCFSMNTAMADDAIGVDTVTINNTRDRLAEVLEINQVTASVKAQQSCQNATIILHCYRDGAKVKSIEAVGVRHAVPQSSADISIQVVDLDHLPLSKKMPGFTRSFCKLTTQGGGVSMLGATTHDLEKAAFDIHTVNGAGEFSDRAEFNGSFPLFYQLRTTSGSVSGGRSPAELLRANPRSDIMIVSILLTNPEKQVAP
jgi:hypothetical protein